MSTALRISLIYVIIGTLWLATSDSILNVFSQQNAKIYLLAETLKGAIFIGVTATILYVMLRHEFNARFHSEKKVIEREARFHLLFSSSPLPMWVYDRKTLEFIDVNAASCAQYGYSREEFLTMRITQLRPSETVPHLMEYLSRTSHDLRYAGEWRHLTKDGQTIPVESWVHSLDFSGRKASLVIIRDLTERKRVEAEELESEHLRLMLAKESEMHAIRSRFLSMVSHEFRRPVTNINSSVELLERYRNRMTEESSQKHFSRIHEQIAEITELLDDFLVLMRSEAGEQEFKPALVDLTALCQKLIDQSKLSASETHSIVYTSNCPEVIIDGDEKLLRCAVGNLLSNAIKYSPKGGEVRLTLTYDQALELRVTDQGIGIPAADQPYIFDPFLRATNVGDMKGSGLGLAIAKQAIERHNGTLEIVKSGANGTEFIIKLPVKEPVSLTGC